VRRFVVSDSRCKESRFVGRIVVCRKDSRMYEGQLYVGRTVGWLQYCRGRLMLGKGRTDIVYPPPSTEVVS
jgi:hypothetical protein